jgi:glycosyltransferase involved in cell wall biosynthesis
VAWIVDDNPLHILMMDPHLAGGGQVRYVSNLAERLTQAGHRVVIGCKPGSVLVASAAGAGCEALPVFSLKGGLRPRAWCHDIAALARYQREHRPDVIHVSGSQDHWVAGATAFLTRHRVCVVRTRHNTYVVKDHVPNRILNRAWTDYQIVVCGVVRRELARQRAFDADRMCSIHNGVDAEAYRPDPAARAAVRAEFGYREDDLVIGIAARLVKAKGHTYLFQAVAQLRETHPNLRILALGQGTLEEKLREEASHLGLAGAVTWAGFRDDMARCVQAFDIGVQPSIDCDTSSFSLKEQMAAEKPVIASDYGGLTEIVTHGEEGLIVAAGAVAPLSEAIASLADDSERRRMMGEKGRARVLREFTIDIFARRTVEAYRRAIDLHQDRRGRP